MQVETSAQVPVLYSAGVTNRPVVCQRMGDEAFVDIQSASRFGWEAQHEGATAKLTAYGKKIELSAREVGGSPKFPLRAAISLLGGMTEWTTEGLKVFATVRNIKAETTGITVESSTKVSCRVSTVDRPPRIVLDLSFAKVDPANPPKATGSLRSSQFSNDTVRIVVQVDKLPTSTSQSATANHLRVSWAGAKSVKTQPYTGPAVSMDPMMFATPVSPDELPPAVAELPFVLGAPRLERESETEAIIAVPFFGRALGFTTIERDERGFYVIDLPGAALLAPEQLQIISGQFVKSASVTKTRTGAQIRFSFTRLLIPRVAAAAGELVIRATPPVGVTGTIRGKIVMIDARRGGPDIGEQFTVNDSTFRESDLNLEIAKQIASTLTSAGATVILSRTGDQPMTDYDRTVLANVKKAHFLVSVGASVEHSTPCVQYHSTSMNGRLMAEAVASKVQGEVRTLNTWLLKESRMPAIIVTYGKLSEPELQRRLAISSERKKIADAISNGILSFARGEAQ